MLTFTATISLLLAPPPPPENYFLIVLPVPHAKLTPGCPQKLGFLNRIAEIPTRGRRFFKISAFPFPRPRLSSLLLLPQRVVVPATVF